MARKAAPAVEQWFGNTSAFERQAKQMRTEGGFTVDPRTGEEPSAGYMVGQYGTTRKLPKGEATGKAIASYAAQHQMKGRYLGGWAAPEGDYIEQSTRYEPTPAGHTAARLASMVGNQQAYYARHTQEEHTSPWYESDEEPAQRRRLARMSGATVTSPLPQPRRAS